MPKLSKNRLKKTFSPFQKLINGARQAKNLTYQQLGDEIGAHRSSVFIWLNSVQGYPHPKSFNEKHLIKLSKVLSLPVDQIKQAIDASRSLYVKQEMPPSPVMLDHFLAFIKMIESGKTKYILRSKILSDARSFYHQASSVK